MPRRKHIDRRVRLPDAKYSNLTLSELINKFMYSGKKSTSEQVIYGALEIIQEKEKGDPIATLELALKNSTPLLEVKARRVGGATYQVPTEVRPERRTALAMRWLKTYARSRNEKSMSSKLASELISASNNEGSAVKKKEDTHKMAEANKAFAHFKW